MHARLSSFSRVIQVCLIAAGLSASPAQAQQRVAIQGTTVSLVPAKGFEPAAGFSGLQNQANSSSLVVVELPPVAYEQVARLFADLDTAKQNFARQNVTAQRLEQIDVAGAKAPLVVGEQKMGGITFDKWIALMKGDRTVMVTVQAPKEAGLAAADVKAMLSSVSLGKEPSLDDKLAALPFRIRASEPFRVVEALAGSTVLMTAGPLDMDPQATQPMIIASYQLSGNVEPGQVRELSERLLKTTRGFEQAEIAESQAVRFAGRDGALLTGTHDAPGGGKRSFAHYMAVGESGRYLRLIVSAEEGRFKELGPQIKAIVDSAAFAERK